jgi:hypothetical protein
MLDAARRGVARRAPVALRRRRSVVMGMIEFLVRTADRRYWARRTETVFVPKSPTARSDLPSPLRSPTAMGLDPLVREAFGDLFGSLIATQGKLRPKDRSLVIGLLDVLRDHDVTFTPEHLRAWVATRQGESCRRVARRRQEARTVVWGEEVMTFFIAHPMP